MPRLVAATALAALAAACSGADAPPGEPRVLLENPEDFGRRDRNHSLTESPDGALRVFAAQRGDHTDLMLMRKQDGDWSAPVLIDLPRRDSATDPRFSPVDGRLYFSTDAPHPDRPGRKDRNIWSIELAPDGSWSDLQVMPDAINTGAHEGAPAFASDGTLYFVSDHTRGVGGFDIYVATPDRAAQDGWRIDPMPHNTAMADDQVAVTPDGGSIFYYAHLPDVNGLVDVFRVDRAADGFSEPLNLGAPINTDLIDYGPGVSADGETLFFSRQGELMEIAMDAVPKR